MPSTCQPMLEPQRTTHWDQFLQRNNQTNKKNILKKVPANPPGTSWHLLDSSLPGMVVTLVKILRIFNLTGSFSLILLLIGKSYSEVELSPLGCLSSSSHRATGATGGVYIDLGLVSNVVLTQTPDRNIKYKPARFKSARYR